MKTVLPTLVAASVVAAIAALGCGTSAAPAKSMTLAAGTTLQDSGLFDVLIPRCRAETGIDVKVVAVGTGQALEIAKRGDADALLTHSPEAEKEFLAAGWAESREEVFWNDFLIAGPKGDPAGIGQAKAAVEALALVSKSQ